MNRYGPRFALTNRAHFKAIITAPSARRIGELDSNLFEVEARMKRQEAPAGRPVGEDLAVIVLFGASLKELRDKLDMTNQHTSDK